MTSVERHPGQEIAERQATDRGAVRPPVGLLLSIGEVKKTTGGVEYPSKLDHFRAKEGKVGQYQREVDAFNNTYGTDPKVIGDVWFLSDIVPFVLDVRLLAFSKTGFRGRSLENFAALDPAGFDQKVRDPFTDTAFEFFPKDATEVRPELREAWDGEPVTDTLTGPADPRIDKLGIKLVCQLEFMLPEVMGVGRVARITTSSRRSTRNLYSGVWDQWSFFGGRLRGVPFRLEVRPYSGQRFVREGCPLCFNNEFPQGFAKHVKAKHQGQAVAPYKGYTKFDAYELLLDTALTYGEIRDAIASRRRELGDPTEEQRAVEARVFQHALALPAPPDIDESTREEPVAGPDEAVLNRIAALQQEIEQAGGDWLTALRGVYGVEDARALAPDDAVRYAEQLERALPAEEVDGEVVDEPVDTVDSLPEAQADAATGETVEDGLTASVPQGPADDEELAGPASTDDLAATVIPVGRRRGKTFAQMETLDPRWFDWAVAHPQSFPGQTGFLERLSSYMETREP